MKDTETCRCGASKSVEDDNPMRIQAIMREWREQHNCAGPLPVGFSNGHKTGGIVR